MQWSTINQDVLAKDDLPAVAIEIIGTDGGKEVFELTAEDIEERERLKKERTREAAREKLRKQKEQKRQRQAAEAARRATEQPQPEPEPEPEQIIDALALLGLSDGPSDDNKGDEDNSASQDSEDNSDSEGDPGGNPLFSGTPSSEDGGESDSSDEGPIFFG